MNEEYTDKMYQTQFLIPMQLSKVTQQFVEIKNYIDDNLSKNITIPGICRRFVINRTKLQSGFRELFGTPAYTYILRQRMEQAAKRILSSDDSIKVIALDSGYKQPRSFNKAFKSIFKDTPISYRKKHQLHA